VIKIKQIPFINKIFVFFKAWLNFATMRKLRNHELNRKNLAEFKDAPKSPMVVVLDNVRSLHNIGSVFRTCDAFLVEKLYLCGVTACPPNKEIHKTALGSTESVEWKYFEHTADAVEELKEGNYWIFSVEQAENSISLESFKPEKDNKYAFIFGHEVKGIKQEVVDSSDGCIEIPQYGTKHSLNIAVSAGIVIWDVYNKISMLKHI
jgi:23S rRNA (guanosine2251-2'-O)-methyltransferase